MKCKAPILETLIEYHNEENLILSMPGNKAGKMFLKDDLGKGFVERLGFLDITEVGPLDNLHNPEGIIKEAQELLAKVYGSNKGYFLVNGATSGNLAAVFAAFNEGDEVVVERNCHKSIYNALILRKLKVIYIDSVIDNENNLLLPPSRKEIYSALEKSINPKGIILTYPNYYGISYNIEDIILELKYKGITTIIDAAHGAHYCASEEFPKSITSIADYIVTSAHKTLPALTGGAYLLVNTESNVDFYVKAFMTTSPSYLIMASLDYSRYYLETFAKEDYKELIKRAIYWKDKINNLNKVTILEEKHLSKGYSVDKTRYLIMTNNKLSGHNLSDYLISKKIQCELSYSSGVLVIFSPCNGNEDFEKLYSAIEELELNEIVNTDVIKINGILPEKVYDPYEVFNKEYNTVALEKAIGKVAKDSIIPYPPGIPLVLPGERISIEVLEILQDYISNNRQVIGVESNLVRVLK